MKRALGAMAANWLRKPENQQKIKQTARQFWSRFNDRKRAGSTAPAQAKARPDPAVDSSPQPGRQGRRAEQSGDDPQG